MLDFEDNLSQTQTDYCDSWSVCARHPCDVNNTVELLGILVSLIFRPLGILSLNSDHKSSSASVVLSFENMFLSHLDMALVTANNVDWQYSKTSLCERFKTLHHLSKWTDCTFVVGFDEHCKIINCHKLVLAASSPVFEALFYGLLATSECDRPIRVPDIEPSAFHLMLQYLYEDSVRFTSVQEAGSVLYAAKKYLLPHLGSLCIKYLEQNVRISTLWDILCVAENLSEETLLAACVKVMCKSSIDVWWDDAEHMSVSTLKRFLNEPLIDTCEKKLFEVIIAWSETECILKNIPVTPSNVRAVIDKFSLFSKIRLLTLSSPEFEEIQDKFNVFKDCELQAIRGNLASQENLAESSMESSEKVQSLSLPRDFCSTTEKRRKSLFSAKKCTRAILSRKNTWTYGGSMFSVVSSSSKMLVTGFEVYTRLASQIDFVINRGQPNTYKEQFVLCIKNEADEEINQTKYENVVEYNSSQIINLSKPVCFLPKMKYTVKIELPSGQYPLNNLSKSAFTKFNLHFNFNDCARYRDRYFGDHEVRDAGFISGILYSV